MSESDEWATVETVNEDGYDSESARGSFKPGPHGIDQGIVQQILSLLTSINPWFLLLVAVALYWFYQKAQTSIQKASSASGPTLSQDEVLAREEAIEAARRRMQEQYDQKAREYALKQKEKEERMRLEKLENLEKYGTKLGKSNKVLVAEAEPAQQGIIKKKPEKSRLRPEYNPLMDGGAGGGACFRPSRRGGAQGG